METVNKPTIPRHIHKRDDMKTLRTTTKSLDPVKTGFFTFFNQNNDYTYTTFRVPSAGDGLADGIAFHPKYNLLDFGIQRFQRGKRKLRYLIIKEPPYFMIHMKPGWDEKGKSIVEYWDICIRDCPPKIKTQLLQFPDVKEVENREIYKEVFLRK